MIEAKASNIIDLGGEGGMSVPGQEGTKTVKDCQVGWLYIWCRSRSLSVPSINKAIYQHRLPDEKKMYFEFSSTGLRIPTLIIARLELCVQRAAGDVSAVERWSWDVEC